VRDDLVNLSLIAASCAYAAWLREHKKAEPDFIWAEVVIGVAYTLAGARLKRPRPGGWLARDAHIYAAFAYAGIPIIVGEVAQRIERRRQRAKMLDRWLMEV